MQHYELCILFKMLRHLYDTPTFKTNALHLVSNEQCWAVTFNK